MTNHSIAIAEPDLIVAKSIERLLQIRGHSVIAIAATGTAILKEAGEHRPDLVLVNTRLKDGMKGIDVAQTLMETFDIPSVLIAAFPDDILLGGYQDADIYGYLIKPFSEKNLHLAIGTALSRYRKEREVQKEQALASIGVLAGGLAHDLNNILTTMVGRLSLCRMSISDERGLTHLDELEKSIFRIRDVTRQLMTFTKGGKPIRKIVPVHPIVARAVQAAFTTPKTLYDINVPEDLWQVDVDEDQIVLSLRNLIRNASQAMHDEGMIQINGCNKIIQNDNGQGTSHRRFVRISVSDHGIGIEKEQLGKIFDPYVTTKSGSSGIGLTAVHSIVKQHGGQVIAESDPGLGSTFHILLPAAELICAAPERSTGSRRLREITE